MLRALTAALLVLTAHGATSSAMAHLGRGSELMRAEQYEQAAREFAQALRVDPDLAEARLDLAVCRFQLRDYEQARELFSAAGYSAKQKALATYYRARMDLLDQKPDAAIAELASLAGQGEVRDEKYYVAVALIDKEQYAEAAHVLRQWIAEDPRDFRAHQRLARTLLKLGREQEAAQEFARTRELHAWYTEGSVALRSCQDLLTQGRGADAWRECGPLAETDDVDKLVALGMVFGEKGDAAHARGIWQRAATLDPDSPEINYNLGLSCFQLREMACARTSAGNAVRLWPDFPEANVLYGTVLYMLKDDAGAKRVLEHALELRPDDTMVRRLLVELQK